MRRRCSGKDFSLTRLSKKVYDDRVFALDAQLDLKNETAKFSVVVHKRNPKGLLFYDEEVQIRYYKHLSPTTFELLFERGTEWHEPMNDALKALSDELWSRAKIENVNLSELAYATLP